LTRVSSVAQYPGPGRTSRVCSAVGVRGDRCHAANADRVLGKDAQAVTRGGISSFARSAPWRSLDTTAEAAEIDRQLTGSSYGPVRKYVGGEALQEVFQAQSSPRILHVATHGFFLDDPSPRAATPENPLLRSGIVLAGTNVAPSAGGTSTRVADGWVTAEDVVAMNLAGTELVVLSACETGLGRVVAGDGVYGLRRAFILAGARSLITSLYKVPNHETAGLMKAFYESLARGKGKLDSLREAQLSVLRQRRNAGGAAHPFYWASFILIGDPR
jgi:CHAT domain-containing protein